MRLLFVIPAQAGIQEMGQYFIYILASKRKWKLELIESSNPNWEDLYYTLSN
jgi:hypothetical protein